MVARLHLLVVYCVVLVFTLVFPSGALSAPDQETGSRLVFSTFRNGRWDLYGVDANGQNLRQLTDDAFEDKDPAYSPDGSRLAYASRRENNWDVYVLDLATGDETRLTNHHAYDAAPTWNPEGTRIAFESQREGDLDVWVVDLDGGEPANLTADSSAGDFAPAWSPDGDRLAFSSWRGESKDLYVLNLAGGDVVQVTHDESSEEWPAWSPDGQRLAYVRNYLGEREVFLMDSSADAPARQATWLGRDEGPAWSPDGSQLAFLNLGADGDFLMRLTVDQEVDLPQRLTPVAWIQGRPAWNGQAIDFGTPLESLADVHPTTLYEEQATPSTSGEGEPWDLLELAGVQLPTPDMTPYMSDRVNDSFLSLRRSLAAEVGYDFLGQLSEAYRPYHFFSDTSEYASWHKSGRAIDILFDYHHEDKGQVLEIARDDRGGETFWRVYLRCLDQSGACGQPLTANTWNYSHEARADIAPDQGGIEKAVIGDYYVDLTSKMRQYGWQRISSWDSQDFSWTWHFKGFEYWHFQKTDGMAWYQTMQEVFPQYKLDEFFTYELMHEQGDPPTLIALKGVPLPAEPRLWWSRLRP